MTEKLIIELPEEIRQVLINNIQLSPDQQFTCDSHIKHAIINGTPLPSCEEKQTRDEKGDIVNRKIEELFERVENIEKQIKEDKEEQLKKLKAESEFHCGVEESGGHAYNCNDCPNKCDEWYRWDKEFELAKRKKEKK